jgi:hypothetical protein
MSRIQKSKGWHFDLEYLELFRTNKLTGVLGSGRCRASGFFTAIKVSFLKGVLTFRGKEKLRTDLKSTQISNPYRAVNTPPLSYTDQSVNAV